MAQHLTFIYNSTSTMSQTRSLQFGKFLIRNASCGCQRLSPPLLIGAHSPNTEAKGIRNCVTLAASSSSAIPAVQSRSKRSFVQSTDTAKMGGKSQRTLKTATSSASFINPFLELQKYMSVPILSDQQLVFNPSDAEVSQGVSIFSGGKGRRNQTNVKFVGVFRDGSEIPDSELPEVCFLGRSNVGKSSLLQYMLEAHENVRISISQRPGHTKALNMYQLGQHFTLVDMPGYGHNMPQNFQLSVEKYLSSRKRLCRTFLLVDGDVGVTSTDSTALDMLNEFGIPFVVVLTKIDKAGRHKLLKNVLSTMKYERH